MSPLFYVALGFVIIVVLGSLYLVEKEEREWKSGNKGK